MTANSKVYRTNSGKGRLCCVRRMLARLRHGRGQPRKGEMQEDGCQSIPKKNWSGFRPQKLGGGGRQGGGQKEEQSWFSDFCASELWTIMTFLWHTPGRGELDFRLGFMNYLLRCGQVWHVSKFLWWTVSHLFCIREVIGQGVSNKVETRSQFNGCELKLTKSYCKPREERNGHAPKDWTRRRGHKYITCRYIIWPMKESVGTGCLQAGKSTLSITVLH